MCVFDQVCIYLSFSVLAKLPSPTFRHQINLPRGSFFSFIDGHKKFIDNVKLYFLWQHKPNYFSVMAPFAKKVLDEY